MSGAQGPPGRESRPAATTAGPAQGISTATKTRTSVTARGPRCSEHGEHWPCPLHGCPECAVEAFAYDDPEAVPGPEELEHLVAAYVDEAGCLICQENAVRAAWAAFPDQECEATCALQHCTVCGLCGRSGLVCRVCGVCVEHEEQGSTLACWSTIWSKARGREVEFYRHELWNPDTGRWAR